MHTLSVPCSHLNTEILKMISLAGDTFTSTNAVRTLDIAAVAQTTHQQQNCVVLTSSRGRRYGSIFKAREADQ